MSRCRRGPVEERVLASVRPTRFQLAALSRMARLLLGRLEGCVGSRARVELVGSYAKGTLIWDKWELDVFVLYEGADDEWLASTGIEAVRRCLYPLPLTERYAEHPYVTVSLMGVEADVVPARLVSSPAEARGVERTPFHTRYVKSRLNACLADDVRLLKSFLKGIGAYGAETHIGGFSGYLSELLVIHYGGFREVLEAAANWKPPVFIDPEGDGDFDFLRRRYPDSPIIVVDPVDPRRNAAAAVRLDKLALFALAARLYLRYESEVFFHTPGRGVPRHALPEPDRVGVVVYRGEFYLEPPESVWGRLYRAARLLAQGLEDAGFKVARVVFYTDEASVALAAAEVEDPVLGRVELREGPPAWAGERALRFAVKRVLEGGAFWVDDRGGLAGVRPRRVRVLEDAVRFLAARLPAPPRGVLWYAGSLEGLDEPWRGAAMSLFGEGLHALLASVLSRRRR